MFGRASTKESKAPIEGLVSIRVSQWEKLRRILSIRYNKTVDDREVMYYVLRQGNLMKGNCTYGIFFDVDGEHVILEV